MEVSGPLKDVVEEGRRRCEVLVVCRWGAVVTVALMVMVMVMMQRFLGRWLRGLDRFLYISRSSLEVPISSRDDFMST